MSADVLAVVLAGGRARRMGGVDKGLLRLGEKTLLDIVLDRLAPQAERVVINANGDAARFARWRLPVVADGLPDRPGPLAGVLAGCDWAAMHCPGIGHVVTVAADTPFFPPDLVVRLEDARRRANRPIALAATREDGRIRKHPVFGLWPVAGRQALRAAVQVEGVRRILDWTDREGSALEMFDSEGGDPFFNVNCPEDLEVARQRCLQMQ